MCGARAHGTRSRTRLSVAIPSRRAFHFRRKRDASRPTMTFFVVFFFFSRFSVFSIFDFFFFFSNVGFFERFVLAKRNAVHITASFFFFWITTFRIPKRKFQVYTYVAHRVLRWRVSHWVEKKKPIRFELTKTILINSLLLFRAYFSWYFTGIVVSTALKKTEMYVKSQNLTQHNVICVLNYF